ncbi:hypothetical protein KAW48_05040, partial [candidate division WOR-3 bacterium]|nr:hypothetical protein [candidate division WOR-3 bacterium]
MVLKRVFVVLIVCIVFLPISVFSSDGEKGVTQDWLSKALANIEKGEYKPSMQKRDYKGEEFSEPKCHFTNRAKHLRAYLDKNYIDIMPRKVTNTDNWHLRYYINSINKGIEPEILRNAILYNDKDITLRYTNSEEGIKQEISIKNKPEEEGDLLIRWDIETEGLIVKETKDNYVRYSATGYEIIYKIQSIEDADNSILKGSINIEDDEQISISVDDANANYPIRMKLLITTNREKDKEEGLFIKNITKGLDTIPDWTAESNQASAYFGYSVS